MEIGKSVGISSGEANMSFLKRDFITTSINSDQENKN